MVMTMLRITRITREKMKMAQQMRWTTRPKEEKTGKRIMGEKEEEKEIQE